MLDFSLSVETSIDMPLAYLDPFVAKREEFFKSSSANPISESLLQRLEQLTDQKPCRLLCQQVAFAHRDFDLALDKHESGEPFALCTVLNSIGASLHLGQCPSLRLLKWLQEVFKAPTIIMVKADAQSVNFTSHERDKQQHFRQDIKDIIALGFDPDLTFIFSSLDYVNASFHFQSLRFGRCLSVQEIAKKTGLDVERDNISTFHSIAAQNAALFASSFPDLFARYAEQVQTIPTLAILDADNDTGFWVSREYAASLGVIRPSFLYCASVSRFDLNTDIDNSITSNILLSDNPDDIERKLSQSRTSLDTQSEIFNSHWFRILRCFSEDNNELEEITSRLLSRHMQPDELGVAAINSIQRFTSAIRAKRSLVTDETLQKFTTPSPIGRPRLPVRLWKSQSPKVGLPNSPRPEMSLDTSFANQERLDIKRSSSRTISNSRKKFDYQSKKVPFIMEGQHENKRSSSRKELDSSYGSEEGLKQQQANDKLTSPYPNVEIKPVGQLLERTVFTPPMSPGRPYTSIPPPSLERKGTRREELPTPPKSPGVRPRPEAIYGSINIIPANARTEPATSPTTPVTATRIFNPVLPGVNLLNDENIKILRKRARHDSGVGIDPEPVPEPEPGSALRLNASPGRGFASNSSRTRHQAPPILKLTRKNNSMPSLSANSPRMNRKRNAGNTPTADKTLFSPRAYQPPADSPMPRLHPQSSTSTVSVAQSEKQTGSRRSSRMLQGLTKFLLLGKPLKAETDSREGMEERSSFI